MQNDVQESTIQKLTTREIMMVKSQRLFDLGFGKAMKMSKNKFFSAIPLPKKGKTGHILVISPRCVSISAAMALIKVDRKKGHNYIDSTSLMEIAGAPTGMFYWRYGLLYNPCLGQSLGVREKIIKEERRILGTVNEGIYAIAQHPEILRGRWLYCLGSRSYYGAVPYLSIDKEKGGPMLYVDSVNCLNMVGLEDTGLFSFKE